MRYLSIFSGIEAATVAFRPLGWRPVVFADVDAFPSAVLNHRFPEVVNLGDVTKVPYRGRPAEECPDGPRYKAIVNSMAVPVMRLIARRIDEADREA